MNRVTDTIGWATFSINPIKGLCPVDCKDTQGNSYCYARRLYDRFGWNPIIRYDDWVWQEGPHIPQGARVFVGSTMELFGPWIEQEWLEIIFEYCRACPSVTFLFLTKRPQELAKWSPFPDNCWVGASATDYEMFKEACRYLPVIKAGVKFISFEPLLSMEWTAPNISFWLVEGNINWVIIGACTPYSKYTFPRWVWVKEIIESADRVGVPVFLKSNLRLPKYNWEGSMPFYKRHPTGTMELRQEFPDVQKIQAK